MPKNLDFSKLVPERDTFTDTDGEIYEFASRADFGVSGYAKISRIQKQLNSVMEEVAGGDLSEGLANQFEALVSEFVGQILPGLPAERIKAMKLGQQMQIVQWWQAQNAIEDGEEEGKQGESGAG